MTCWSKNIQNPPGVDANDPEGWQSPWSCEVRGASQIASNALNASNASVLASNAVIAKILDRKPLKSKDLPELQPVKFWLSPETGDPQYPWVQSTVVMLHDDWRGVAPWQRKPPFVGQFLWWLLVYHGLSLAFHAIDVGIYLPYVFYQMEWYHDIQHTVIQGRYLEHIWYIYIYMEENVANLGTQLYDSNLP